MSRFHWNMCFAVSERAKLCSGCSLLTKGETRPQVWLWLLTLSGKGKKIFSAFQEQAKKGKENNRGNFEMILLVVFFNSLQRKFQDAVPSKPSLQSDDNWGDPGHDIYLLANTRLWFRFPTHIFTVQVSLGFVSCLMLGQEFSLTSLL